MRHVTNRELLGKHLLAKIGQDIAQLELNEMREAFDNQLNKISSLIGEMQVCIDFLNRNAIQSYPIDQLFDDLIKKEKMENKQPGLTQRIAILEILKDKSNAKSRNNLSFDIFREFRKKFNDDEWELQLKASLETAQEQSQNNSKKDKNTDSDKEVGEKEIKDNKPEKENAKENDKGGEEQGEDFLDFLIDTFKLLIIADALSDAITKSD